MRDRGKERVMEKLKEKVKGEARKSYTIVTSTYKFFFPFLSS